MNRLIKALLIVNLELFLLAPQCVSQKVERGPKTADQYWAETGLGSNELETLLSDESCHLNQQSFLGCVNAVGQMAERYGLVLTLDGKLRPLEQKDIEDRASEKKDLSRWTPIFSRPEVGISFLQLWKNIESQYVKESEKSGIVAAGINGFLSVYRDPHTYIMPLAMYDEVIASSESRASSAGLVARRSGQELIVRKVFEGSSAAKAGVRKGDRIIALNGEPISRILPSRVNEILRMRNSDRLGLQVLRQGQEKYLEILKAENVYPSVVARLMNQIGLITIHKFSKDACQMTRQQLVSLKEQNAKGILLDLRDNPGGQVEEAACVVGLFVPRGTFLFETRYLDVSKPSDRYVSEDEQVYKGPLAVLVNSGSASAAEIVAGSLRDQNRAKLVGERTFGKGSFQDGRLWGPNTKIALFETEGLYYFPSGWTPQLVGLQPDIQVNFNTAEGLREEEMFYNPLVPLDSWTGPQALSWLTERECEVQPQIFTVDSEIDDPQLRKAQALLTCGEKNDRNGSL